jgi:AraC-like DNA-binding protein
MSIAATVGDALDLLSRHLGLHTSALVVTTRSVPEGLTIEFGTTYRGAGSDRQIMEYGMALITDFLRGYLPDQWRPLFVQFRHASPASLRLHHAAFGQNVYFNQEHNSICIDRAVLATPIHSTSAEKKKITSRLIRQRGFFDARGTVDRTHGMVRALLPYSTDCSIAAVAKLLGMSTRSLQRDLAEAEVTFEAIRDSIRADLARKYLMQSTMSVAEIADVLGYSQPSAFARSFRRWHQMSPLRFRKAGGALTASS